MIDPDLHNINMIPESKLTMIEIENVSKIKRQNTFLRNSLILIILIGIVASIKSYYNKEDNEKNKS